jgi:hypothetical protein
MGNEYYTTISRDEFISLYKFGNININTNFIILNSDNMVNEIIKLLSYMPFSQDEDYLILKFKDDDCLVGEGFNEIKTIFNLKIKKIKDVYTLSEKAQYFYKTKFNKRINFQIIPYKNILVEVTNFSEIKDMNLGIDILFEEYDLGNKEKTELELGYDLKESFLAINNYLETNFKNIYLDILFYKRENKFEKEDVGYILDLIIVTILKERKDEIINKFKRGELKLNNSPTYNNIINSNKNTLFEYIDFIKKSDDENIKKFLDKINISVLISGAIFLKIKYLLLNKNAKYKCEINKTIAEFKDLYFNEVSISLYLIGLVFGYKGLYDDYYSFINLDIFIKEKTSFNYNVKANKIEKIDIKNPIEEKNDLNNEKDISFLNFTDIEIIKMSLSALKELAKKRGLRKGLSKFKGNDEDKLKLYKEIKEYKDVFIN